MTIAISDLEKKLIPIRAIAIHTNRWVGGQYNYAHKKVYLSVFDYSDTIQPNTYVSDTFGAESESAVTLKLFFEKHLDLPVPRDKTNQYAFFSLGQVGDKFNIPISHTEARVKNRSDL